MSMKTTMFKASFRSFIPPVDVNENNAQLALIVIVKGSCETLLIFSFQGLPSVKPTALLYPLLPITVYH